MWSPVVVQDAAVTMIRIRAQADVNAEPDILTELLFDRGNLRCRERDVECAVMLFCRYAEQQKFRDAGPEVGLDLFQQRRGSFAVNIRQAGHGFTPGQSVYDKQRLNQLPVIDECFAGQLADMPILPGCGAGSAGSCRNLR